MTVPFPFLWGFGFGFGKEAGMETMGMVYGTYMELGRGKERNSIRYQNIKIISLIDSSISSFGNFR